jgi:beta-lactamase superfamily II metal-dependent hydrolase
MRIILGVCLSLLCGSALGQENGRSPLEPVPNSLFLRVIDTGPGLATLTIVTGNTNSDRKVMIYDGGHWDDDDLMIDELEHYLRQRKTIDVMIISHADSDHLGTADTILKYWKVKKSVRNGWNRDRSVGTFWAFRRALTKSVTDNDTQDFVMGDGDPALGETWSLGDAKITFLSGFGVLPDGWDVGVPPSHSRFESKALNSVSVVIRVDYGQRSIVLAGDAVGRLDEEPPDQLIATEKFLVENSAERPLRADILFAPHHGADNASSAPFIDAVQPAWVIFSSGTVHKHPKLRTFERYQDNGVAVDHMLRTDRGDKKHDTEWEGDWSASCTDKHGDDGISILIRESDGEIIIDQDPPADPDKGC